MRRSAVLLIAGAACACAPADDQRAPLEQQRPAPIAAPAGPVRAPVLSNREEVLAYRDEAARTLLQPGDSITVYVFARIDENGVAHQTEVKEDIADQRVVGAAISVVQKMKFTPAQSDGQPKSVLLTIPVRFVHRASP